MGVLPQTLLLAQLNMKQNDESIWKQTSMKEDEDQEASPKGKSNNNNFKRMRIIRNNNSLMKKRRSRSFSARIDQRVSMLRNLVPNTNDNEDDEGCSVGSIDQLFTETADYILSLQTTVKLMKTLVDVLSGSSSSSSNDHE